MAESRTKSVKLAAKYHRARIRHFLFTVGPNRISGGRVRRRYLAQDVVIRQVEIGSPRWPAAFDGLRIGHVSDFHLGDLLPLDRALAIMKQLSEQQPDLIACTGDVVDLHHHEAGSLLKAMADASAPMGSLLVLGNHDELHCSETLTQLARSAGVVALRNEAMEINRNGQRLRVAGIDWAKSAVACARNIDATVGDSVHLLLAHNPKAFLRASDLDIPLTLAGHTHGGQIALRKRPHHASQACRTSLDKLKVGLFESGDSRLYVTSGVGAWFPLRINCPAEIAMITMRHVAEPQAQVRQKPMSRARRNRLRRS